MILDHTGKEYVLPETEERSVNLNQYLRFLSDAPTSKIISPARSFALSTVYSCIRLLSDAIAMTPFYLFRQTPGSPEIERIFDGPLAALTRQSSPLFNNFTFWQSMIASLNGWGNAYAVIIRTNNGMPSQLIYMTPNMVDILDTEDPRFRFLQGEVPFVYQVTTGMETFFVRPDDMVHLTLFTYDGIRGLSPIALNQTAVQMENDQTQYGRAFYQKGGKVSGVIESPLKTTRENAKEFINWFNTFYGGENSGQVAFLPGGMTFKGVSVVNPQDAQWVESRKFSRNEIASIFRVPSYLLGDLDRATWGNVSQLSEEFVRYSLQPVYTLIEVELNRKLLENSQTLYYQFDPSILLRGTTAERFQNYSTAVTTGFMSRSEVRQREGLPSNPDLDEFIQMPGATQVGELESSDSRSLALIEQRQEELEELIQWRQQASNYIQMNQNSIIQSGIAFSQKLENVQAVYSDQLANHRMGLDERMASIDGQFTQIDGQIKQVEGQFSQALTELGDRDQQRENCLVRTRSQMAEFSEFIRIQKMRGTKHQDAIIKLKSANERLEKLVNRLEEEIRLLKGESNGN